MSERALWRFYREVRGAVARANEGRGRQPYRHGTFLVDACAGDVELTIQDVSEEDAVLIAGELHALGLHAVVRASTICPHCARRVPDQASCARCRRPLHA